MKELNGKVTSISGEHTARVSVERRWRHPIYKKSVRRSKNYACHFDENKPTVGGTVTIINCRPISKTKHFKIVANHSVSVTKNKAAATKKSSNKTVATKEINKKKVESKL